MCDERIFYLLNNLKTKNTPSHECILDESFIGNVCENFSELLTNTSKEKSFNRSQYIAFLRNYCKDRDGHLKVNNTNFEIFLSSLEISQEYDLDLITYLEDIPQVNNCFIKDLNKFFTKRLERCRSKQQILGLINVYNQKSFNDCFDFIPTKKLENQSENLQLIKKFKMEECLSGGGFCTTSNEHQRDLEIRLGYSVLNLNSVNKDVIVTNIINKLVFYGELKLFEIKFIQYCLEKALFLGQEDKSKELLKRFDFLLEFPLIDLVENIITNDNHDLENNANVLFIKNIISLDNNFKLKILDIVYELYSLSNYCDKVLSITVNNIM